MRVWVALLLLCVGDSWAEERADRLRALGCSAWHEAGHTGRGVTVAILDTGFRGYRSQLGKCLPATITTKSFRRDDDLEAKDSTHGILCAELLHSVAPGARLLFANWDPDEPTTFMAALAWAKEQGASIISCSVVLPGWGDGMGGGPVNATLTKFLKESDIVFVAPTGNMAQRHWSGAFNGTGRVHEWARGRTRTTLAPWPNAPLTIDVSSPPTSTYRVRVYDNQGDEVLGRVVATPSGGHSLRLLPTQPQYTLQIEHWSGAREPFRLTVIGAELGDATPIKSLVFPGENPHVWAIGAVDATHQRRAYSGCGHPERFPDFMACVPFPSQWRREPFDGTSAAVPQGAGLAALVRGRYPTWSSARVQEFLRTHALDLAERGPDATTGHGLLRLPKP